MASLEGTSKKEILTIILMDGPYSSDVPEHAFQLAKRAVEKGYGVNIFLYIDGVWTVHGNQNPEKAKNIAQLVAELINLGVNIKACVRCSKMRGLMDGDVIPGVPVAGLGDLVEWMNVSHRIVSFPA